MHYRAPGMRLLVCAVAFGLLALTRAVKLDVDGGKVVQQLTHLATFSDHPNPAVTRLVFTPNDLLARSYVKQLMSEAGLAIREDPVGNIFGRWEGTDASAGTILSGSHCDAIPLAGMYDGTLGVIGAIEAVVALKKQGYVPKHSIEVMMFTSEEPTRFGLSCSGSRAMAGVLAPEVLDNKPDENGTSYLQAAISAGYGGESHADMLERTKVKVGDIAYFVELHIEQGPLLEQEGLDIGVVTAIAAPAALNVEFFGDGGHGGALLMPYRNDAGLAGAELSLEVESHVLATGAIDTVGTTGVFEVKPGAVNSVPREARLGIDIRDINGTRRDEVVAAVVASAERIAARRKVRHTIKMINQDPPATCDSAVVSAVERAAKSQGLTTKHMVSRAYHDSLFMARIAPTGMIFIPCRNGWSHRPDEFSSEAAITAGVKVLALTMAELSGGSFPSDKTEL